MKKYFLYIVLLSISSTLLLDKTFASTVFKSDSSIASVHSVANQKQAEVLTLRLNEIKSLDKSAMSKAEKKILRKEVRAINNALAKNGGGVYLSVGAVIIILLLLIILL